MSIPLSGSFETAELPRIAGEPVTITVARHIRPGYEAAFLRWQSEVVNTVLEAPGCLGATVLHPGRDGGAYQTVFRFADGMSLRNWERSEERAQLTERGATYVVSERLSRTVGVESWFQAPQLAEPKRPFWRRVVGDLAWVYPLSLLMSLIVAPTLMAIPLLPRVLVSSVMFGVVMRAWVGPTRAKLRRRRSF